MNLERHQLLQKGQKCVGAGRTSPCMRWSRGVEVCRQESQGKHVCESHTRKLQFGVCQTALFLLAFENLAFHQTRWNNKQEKYKGENAARCPRRRTATLTKPGERNDRLGTHHTNCMD